ncbi:protein-L-histidine N-pros-methyltransferase isoform X1 [Dendroctonus ponderosae]|nr:protein-L-histidine N-pros-methyltransferase isoform X1 [Dendroctonus ponderosae]XP_048525933.1 protein-L-histidine N-pros-methyltransferase isoform X1 [Dendroctonus ponderosae]
MENPTGSNERELPSSCPIRMGATAGPEPEYEGIPWPGYKPRGSLARMLHNKAIHDYYLKQINKNDWYQCDLTQLHPDVARTFVQLDPDQDTISFLEEAERKSQWVLTQLWHTVVKMFLGWFMTQTSINGWLQRGSMFVVSRPQLLKLLNVDDTVKFQSLLDLGAGDGNVTAQLAPFFHRVYVTEVSVAMKNLLQRQGFSILDIDAWHRTNKYDVISCLNLIDRCDTPLDLLTQIRTALKPDGLVLLAVVLPFSPYVEAGEGSKQDCDSLETAFGVFQGACDHRPKQALPIEGDTFEAQVQSLVTNVLKPAHFEVLSWSRVPYLCEGDLQQSYYWLDDAIFVLKASDT